MEQVADEITIEEIVINSNIKTIIDKLPEARQLMITLPENE